MFCRPSPVPPKTSSRVMSSCAATWSQRGAVAIRSASDLRPLGLALLVLGELGRVPRGPQLGLGPQPGRRPPPVKAEQHDRQPAAQREPDGHRPRPADARDRRDEAEQHEREQPDGDEQPCPQPPGMLRGRQGRHLSRIGSGLGWRGPAEFARAQPGFVGDPAKVQAHKGRLEPESHGFNSTAADAITQALCAAAPSRSPVSSCRGSRWAPGAVCGSSPPGPRPGPGRAG